MSKATYELRVHQAVHHELGAIPDDLEQRLRKRLRRLQEIEQPTEPAWVKSLNDHPALFRVRVTSYRAICALEKPVIYVLMVGEREGLYNKLETAHSRLNAI